MKEVYVIAAARPTNVLDREIDMGAVACSTAFARKEDAIAELRDMLLGEMEEDEVSTLGDRTVEEIEAMSPVDLEGFAFDFSEHGLYVMPLTVSPDGGLPFTKG